MLKAGGVTGITLSVCRTCPVRVFWIAQPFVTKLGVVVHHRQPECHEKEEEEEEKVLIKQVMIGVKQGDSGQRSKPAGLIH